MRVEILNNSSPLTISDLLWEPLIFIVSVSLLCSWNNTSQAAVYVNAYLKFTSAKAVRSFQFLEKPINFDVDKVENVPNPLATR